MQAALPPGRIQMPDDPASARPRERVSLGSDLLRLWRVSALVRPGGGPKVFASRVLFYARALAVWRDVVPLLHPGAKGLGRLVAARPDTVGAVIWPYICLGWDARTRLRRIREHYEAVAVELPLLDIAVEEGLELVDLSAWLPAGIRLVLDKAGWFIREGELVLNLFSGETRLYSLAFSFRLEPRLVAYVGAIQGRKFEGVLEIYRELTSVLHGLRPRDFLVEAFGIFCEVVGVARIYCVADRSRQNRSPYFGLVPKDLLQDYDAVWLERGGRPAGPDFFALPVGGTRRDLTTVPSRKRSMYRKRYELLDRIEASLREALQR